MADNSAKQAERWWGKFLLGMRHPSQGVPHPDISSYWCVVEHKYRQFNSWPAEFRKALSQVDANIKMEANRKMPRVPLLALTLHRGVGQNARRFLVIEVHPKDKDVRTLLERILRRIDEDCDGHCAEEPIISKL